MGLSGPDGEAVRDVLVSERLAQHAIALMKRVLLADGKRDVQAANRVQEAGVVQIGQKMVGCDEVDVLVVISAE
jgi:hypothetical protein